MSAPSPFKTKPLLNPMQIYSLMRDDPLLVSRELSLLFLVLLMYIDFTHHFPYSEWKES